jgi:TrmH family RNA methyltransferase
MERVASRQNALVRRFRELARAGSEAGAALLDGEHLVREALRSAVPLDAVAVSDAASPAATAAARDAAAAGARVVQVPEIVMAAMSPVREPSGIVAIARYRAFSLEECLEHPPQLVLVLVGIQDAGNVGAMIRSAEASGATAVICTVGTADPFGWKALRGGMGSTFRLPVCARQPLEAVLAALREKRVDLLAAVPRAGTLLPESDLKGPVALLLGAEGAGLPPAAAAAADIHVTIPMRKPVESLNVAVAAAIILYEAARQRESTHVAVR